MLCSLYKKYERTLLKFYTTFEVYNKFEKWPHPVRLETKMYFHVSLGFHDKTYQVDWGLFFRIFLPPIFWAQLDHLSHMPEGF